MTEPHPIAPGRLELVRRFVNTRDIEAGQEWLASASDLVGWLREAGLVAAGVRASAAQLHRAVAVREALRELLRSNHSGAPVDASAVRVLDGVAGQLSIGFTKAGGWVVGPTREGVDGAIGQLVALVIEAMADGTWQRLKVCSNDGCKWAFYDRSRARSGRWCYMKLCGNRAKQQAWRDRRPAETPDPRRRSRRH